MCMFRSAVEVIHHYGRPSGACAGTNSGESSLHNYGTQHSFPQFPAPCCTELSRSTGCSESCAPSVYQSNSHQNIEQSAWTALTFVQRYHDDGDEFLDRIITGDETWVSHITPETKQQSMHWRHNGSPCKMKFKQTLLVRKVMCTVIWYRRSIFLVDFLIILLSRQEKTALVCRRGEGVPRCPRLYSCFTNIYCTYL